MQTDPEQIIRLVQGLGAYLTRTDDGLIAIHRPSRVPEELKALIRQHKPRLLPLLPPEMEHDREHA